MGASFALSYGAHLRFGFEDFVSLGLAIAAIVATHIVFFGALRDSLISTTPKAKLWRNLFWYVLYIGVLIVLYGAIYAEIGLKDGGMNVKDTRDFGVCLFFSITVWTTVGYGEISAVHPLARVVAGVEALNGSLVMAIFIAALVPSFQRLFASPTA